MLKEGISGGENSLFGSYYTTVYTDPNHGDLESSFFTKWRHVHSQQEDFLIIGLEHFLTSYVKHTSVMSRFNTRQTAQTFAHCIDVSYDIIC